MKHILLSFVLWSTTIAAFSQSDTSAPRKTEDRREDTIRVGGIIIIKEKNDGQHPKKTSNTQGYHWSGRSGNGKFSTSWFIFDVGYSGYNDRTDYGTQEAQDFLRFQRGIPASAGDYAIRGTRISNFNLWFFMQRMDLYKKVINLKYGFGMETNNYYYKTPISYVDGGKPYTFRDSVIFSKNKIAANYFTAPLMLHINTNPRARNGGFQMSFGVSAGYLFAARQKQISDERGKVKNKSDFNLDNWKIAYVGELGMGPILFYGSYSMTALHRYGLDQMPWNVGVRMNAW